MSGALVAASYAAFTDAGGFDDELTVGDLAGSALFFVATELVPLAIVLRNNGRIPGANRRSAPGRRSARKSYAESVNIYKAAVGACTWRSRRYPASPQVRAPGEAAAGALTLLGNCAASRGGGAGKVG